MVNPKEYRVVVIESILCPTHFRNTLARVLFNHFSVSGVYSHYSQWEYIDFKQLSNAYGPESCIVGWGD